MSPASAKQLVVSSDSVPSHKVPVLPPDVARKIVRILSVKDAFNTMMACKAFWLWGNVLTSVKTSATLPGKKSRRPLYKRSFASLQRFQATRVPWGLKVCEVLFPVSTVPWLTKLAN